MTGLFSWALLGGAMALAAPDPASDEPATPGEAAESGSEASNSEASTDEEPKPEESTDEESTDEESKREASNPEASNPEASNPEASTDEESKREPSSPEASTGEESKREELEERLAALEAELAEERLARLDDDPLQFGIEGHYRVRGHHVAGLFDDHDSGRYLTHRLRLTPFASYQDLAKLSLTVDGLQDVVWGDNASLASTAVFAGNPSTTGLDGRPAPTIALERVWLEMTLPVGVLQAGRQASDWGMGLLANDGDGFDDAFGENHDGSTVDRLLFATRPVAIAQAIAGQDDSGIPLFTAFAVDRLVEDPLIQYYGFRCEPGIERPDDDYRPRCDSDGDGVTDLDHGFTNEDRTPDQRGGDWWADHADDVMQSIFVLVYRDEQARYLGDTGPLTAGTYIVYRTQPETDSKVLVVDGHVKAQVHGVYVEAEGLHIGGTTRAITLPGSVNLGGEDPLAKTADIWGWVGRVGYVQPAWEVVLEHGYASGDDNVADERFTGRPLHRDYNAGFLLYEEILARVTAGLWGETGRGLWSNGGVYNSRYLYPMVRWRPFHDWDVGPTELIGAFLLAWPDRPDGAIIRCGVGEGPGCSAEADLLGWEADLGLKHQWHEHLHLSVEVGWAKATDRVALETAGLDPDRTVFSVQSRVGWAF